MITVLLASVIAISVFAVCTASTPTPTTPSITPTITHVQAVTAYTPPAKAFGQPVSIYYGYVDSDKGNYTIGETVGMSLSINRSAEVPRVMSLELELKEPCDEPDMLYKSPAFVMPAVFQWNVTVPMRIDYSIWVSGGEYCFIATLRDPSTSDVIARDTARFNIDDVPWMEKLKSLEKEMMKTVEEAEL